MQKPWAKLNLTACKSKQLFSLALFSYSSLGSFWSALKAEGRRLLADVNGEPDVRMVPWQQLNSVR